MTFLEAFKRGFNEGRERAHTDAEIRRTLEFSEIVKVIEPNYGRIITLQINADEPLLHMVVQQTVTMAKAINAEAIVSGKEVTLTCPDSVTAETVRKTWE